MIDSPAFSPEALLAKYRAERDKRLQLRPEGNAQYVGIDDRFADMADDPYVKPGFTRDAVMEAVDVAIVGAGLGGMMAAIRLKQQSINNVRLIDKAADFGGTWYWNRYPGAACDVESYIYMPFLEETNYVPTERYAKAPEIFAHCQRIGRHFDLYPCALFQTAVEDVRWDEAADRWIVTTNRGDRLSARFVLLAGGVMHKPKLPGIPGIETYKGHSFHTTRWDYAYTGGSPTTPMDRLADKTVAIIGTGATAVQAIPHLAATAERLYVVQRTPSGVGARGNRPTDPEWAKSLTPGWQAKRMDNFAAIMDGRPWEEDLVQDGWTEIHAGNRGGVQPADQQQMADFAMMEGIRRRIEDTVPDKATAEALKPWYHRMCKRPCFHDEYLESFARPNVTLLDTAGAGVDRITETGLVIGGVEYRIDCIIYASGFEIVTPYWSRLGFQVHGRGGVPLSEAWAGGPRTLHGIFTRGFPNLLMFSTAQGGFAINFVHMLDELAKHAAAVIHRCIAEGIATAEPTPEAEDAWWQQILSHLPSRAAFMLECTPSYMNGEGSRTPNPVTMRAAAFFGGPYEYVRLLREWRDGSDMAGLEKTKSPLRVGQTT